MDEALLKPGDKKVQLTYASGGTGEVFPQDDTLGVFLRAIHGEREKDLPAPPSITSGGKLSGDVVLHHVQEIGRCPLLVGAVAMQLQQGERGIEGAVAVGADADLWVRRDGANTRITHPNAGRHFPFGVSSLSFLEKILPGDRLLLAAGLPQMTVDVLLEQGIDGLYLNSNKTGFVLIEIQAVVEGD